MAKQTNSIVFIWDNFGPTHADRLEAVAIHFANRQKCIGIELYENSSEYDWISEQTQYLRKNNNLQRRQAPKRFYTRHYTCFLFMENQKLDLVHVQHMTGLRYFFLP